MFRKCDDRGWELRGLNTPTLRSRNTLPPVQSLARRNSKPARELNYPWQKRLMRQTGNTTELCLAPCYL